VGQDDVEVGHPDEEANRRSQQSVHQQEAISDRRKLQGWQFWFHSCLTETIHSFADLVVVVVVVLCPYL